MLVSPVGASLAFSVLPLPPALICICGGRNVPLPVLLVPSPPPLLHPEHLLPVFSPSALLCQLLSMLHVNIPAVKKFTLNCSSSPASALSRGSALTGRRKSCSYFLASDLTTPLKCLPPRSAITYSWPVTVWLLSPIFFCCFFF